MEAYFKDCFNCRNVIILHDDEGKVFLNCLTNKNHFEDDSLHVNQCSYYQYVTRLKRTYFQEDDIE